MAYNLKSEEEVKEYLENLGTEYRFGCFNEKNPETCHLLADYFEAIKKDFDKAGKVYKDNCDARDFPKSCFKTANYLLLGKGNLGKPGNFVGSFPYLEKGCNKEDPDACLHLGLMLSSPPVPEIKFDAERAIAALKLSCSKENVNACYYLAGMYISGILKHEFKKQIHGKPGIANNPANFAIQKNMEEAFKYSEKACSLNHLYSCVNLSQMYQRGEGVAKNPTLAEKFKQKAIELEDIVRKTQQPLEFQQGL